MVTKEMESHAQTLMNAWGITCVIISLTAPTLKVHTRANVKRVTKETDRSALRIPVVAVVERSATCLLRVKYSLIRAKKSASVSSVSLATEWTAKT